MGRGSQEPVCPTTSAQGISVGREKIRCALPALGCKIQSYMPVEEIQDCSYMVLKDYVLKDQILLNQLTVLLCGSVIVAVDLERHGSKSLITDLD